QLIAFARTYLGGPHAAEDVVQDVFLQLCMLEESGAAYLTPKHYLFSAVRNRALKYLAHQRVVRRSRVEIRHDGQVPGMSRPSVRADDEVEAKELARALARAVERLPSRCRETYRRRVGGMTHAEIAAAMGTSVRTVETQLT